jgi:hypothetical protein
MVSDALHSFCILQCSGSSILAAIKLKLWPKGLNHTNGIPMKERNGDGNTTCFQFKVGVIQGKCCADIRIDTKSCWLSGWIFDFITIDLGKSEDWV